MENIFEKWPDKISQGDSDINKYILSMMLKHGVFKKMKIECSGGLMAYQYLLKLLIRPGSIITKLLCVHRTGAGKTLTMISCLDNFYYDRRPKLILFPNSSVANNFYSEIMRFPNRYRDFVIGQAGEGILNKLNSSKLSEVAEAKDRVQSILALTGKLSQVGKSKEFPGGPLRSYRYTQTFSKDDPLNKILGPTDNVYSEKIIFMDEIHNLVKPSAELMKYSRQLKTVYNSLFTCKNSVVVGFTATPFVESITEGLELLKMFKQGRDISSQGFISYFYDLPTSIYPRINQARDLDDIGSEFGNIVTVRMKDTNHKYYKDILKKMNRDIPTMSDINRLLNAANESAYYTQSWRKEFLKRLKNEPEATATKLFRVINDVLKNNEKSLVIIDRKHGYKCLKQMFKYAMQERSSESGCKSECWVDLYDKTSMGAAMIDRFNNDSNKYGGDMKIMIIDAENFSEGVSFFGVRKLYLVNPPVNYGLYQQRIGRILRACSYNNLPKRKRNVDIYMYISEGTIDEILVGKLIQEKKEYDSLMYNNFEKPAIDYGFYNRKYSSWTRSPVSNRNLVGEKSYLVTFDDSQNKRSRKKRSARV